MSTTKRSTSDPSIEVLNRQRRVRIDRAAAARLARAVLDHLGREEAGLTIAFIRDRAMRELNRDYRGIDAPTDVLSFVYDEGNGAGEPPGGHLGDLVISVETAQRYARALGLSFAREIEHLVIHGTLHLAGYDHEKDDGEMNRLERRLRRALLE